MGGRRGGGARREGAGRLGLIDALPAGPVAVDTAVFIYLIEGHPEFAPMVRPLFEAADGGDVELVTSGVTLLEVLVVPLRAGDDALAARYEALLTRGRESLRWWCGRERSTIHGCLPRHSWSPAFSTAWWPTPAGRAPPSTRPSTRSESPACRVLSSPASCCRRTMSRACSGLETLLPLNEGSGTTLNDLAPGNHDGQLKVIAPGAVVYAGSMNYSGALTMQVTAGDRRVAAWARVPVRFRRDTTALGTGPGNASSWKYITSRFCSVNCGHVGTPGPFGSPRRSARTSSPSRCRPMPGHCR